MSDDPFADLPQTLELLDVVIPKTRQFTVGGSRLFIPSIEFWNLFTTVRLVWPVAPQLSSNNPTAGWPTHFEVGGTKVDMGGGGAGGDGLMSQGHASTMQPVDQNSGELDVVFADGTVSLSW